MPAPIPLTIHETLEAFEHRLTSEHLTETCLQRITESQPHLNAFAVVTDTLAHEAARASDRRRAQGKTLGPLDGIPIAVKDLFDLSGFPTAGGSRAYASDIAPKDSNVCARLKAAGAVIAGKTTTPELASQAASSALDLRIGVVRSVATAAEKDVRDRFEESLSHLEELGADLIDVEPFEGIELKKPVVNPEFAAAHGERFRQSPDLFGEKARRYLELGLETDETVYIEGPEQRKALQRTVEWRIQGIDAIVCPTSLTTAKPIGEDTRAKEDANITIPFNIARLSMAALPNGFSDGLPTSLLIGADSGHDGTVHNITRALQRVTDHHLTSHPGI